MNDTTHEIAAELHALAAEGHAQLMRLAGAQLNDDLLLITFGPTPFERALEAKVRGWQVGLWTTADEAGSPVIELRAERGVDRQVFATLRKPVAN